MRYFREDLKIRSTVPMTLQMLVRIECTIARFLEGSSLLIFHVNLMSIEMSVTVKQGGAVVANYTVATVSLTSEHLSWRCLLSRLATLSGRTAASYFDKRCMRGIRVSGATGRCGIRSLQVESRRAGRGCLLSGSTTSTSIDNSIGRDTFTEFGTGAQGTERKSSLFRSVAIPKTQVFRNISDHQQQILELLFLRTIRTRNENQLEL